MWESRSSSSGVYMLRVLAPHGAQRHREMAGDFRAVEIGAEQPEHVELAFAERLNQRLADGRSIRRCLEGREKPPDELQARSRFVQQRGAGQPCVRLRRRRCAT